MTLRLVFMGTPDFAVPTLTELVGAGHEVVAAYSQPPRPAGRGMAARKSPVQMAAEGFGIPVLTPEVLKAAETIETFAAHSADAAVVVAYGRILPTGILHAPAQGCLNLHASLLPRWRGAAPINRAIMAGDRETGVCVMRMEEGLDTGPVCLQERVPISPQATAGEVHDQLARMGAGLMVRAVAALSRNTLDCHPQPQEGVTYASKIDKREARIDWSASAQEVHDRIRGLSPFPGAWFDLAGERVKVLRSVPVEGDGAAGDVLDNQLTVACGAGAVRLSRVQRAGKAAMTGEEFLRGTRIAPGTRLG